MKTLIKATELRIGNLILVKGEVTEIYLISGDGVNMFSYMFEDLFIEFEKCEPILLTEEWLLKFGFIANEYDDEFTLLDMMLDCEYTDEHTYNLSIGKQQFSIDIMYVHQLQNLYFALTGKELEIK